ncbi:hypothetical protein KQX54_014272 [Cotesia glomerata]|uniref:Uncharacterized protein n=1 Tax=Cotesia glomerata TaxID=32391 RepID=A0AAV7J6B7_COTGL|nr:hypothetical protein KQX54_014272 [Cotesia glomerata]
MTTEGEQRLEREALFTAEILRFFNDLFDSMNGSPSHEKDTAPLCCNVHDNSPHHEVWAYSKHFNQDDLESTFGWLRQRSCNKKPSCKLITRHLRSFLIDKVGRFQIRHGNTESTSVGDAREINFKDVISTFNNFLLDVNSADSDDEQDACTEDSFTESSVKINAHVSINDSKSPNTILHLSRNEEIMQTLLKIVVVCGDCTESLVRSQGGQSADSSFDKMYTLALSVLNERIVLCCYQKKLSENLKALLQEHFDNGKIDQFWLKCMKHYKEVHARVIGIIIRRFIDDWCAAVNNHLSGKTDNLKKANYIFHQAWKKHQKSKKASLRDADED